MRKELIAALAAIVFSWMAVEAVLYVVETKAGLKRFGELERRNSESDYYHRLKKAPPRQSPAHFHPLFGNFEYDIVKKAASWELLPIWKDPWRSPQIVPFKKDKKRVVLLGDSYVYGVNLEKNETIDYFLREYLGPDYEVITLGCRGHGIDQMTLIGKNVAEQFEPDVVVLCFIAPDLDRSCVSFLDFAGPKPYFTLENDALHLRGVPVPTPYELFERHQTFRAKIRDAFLSWTQRSAVVRLVAQAFLEPSYRTFRDALNVRLLRSIRDHFDGKSKFILMGFGGNIPKTFKEEMKRQGVLMEVAPVEAIAREIQVAPETYFDGHPKGKLNRILAFAVSRAVLGTTGSGTG